MSTPRIVLLMLLLNVLTVAGGVGVSYWLLKPGLEGATAEDAAEAEPVEPSEYLFFPVQKVIVSVRGDGREHYFVLDLARAPVLAAQLIENGAADTQGSELAEAFIRLAITTQAFEQSHHADLLHVLAVEHLVGLQ